jgi:hypothetical protein
VIVNTLPLDADADGLTNLLIVGLGICSQLPYAGDKLTSGEYLVDKGRISLAPSAAWAAASSRPRPL